MIYADLLITVAIIVAIIVAITLAITLAMRIGCANLRLEICGVPKVIYPSRGSGYYERHRWS